MSIDSQKRMLHTIHGLSGQSPYMDDSGYLNGILGKINDLAYKGLHYATRLKHDGVKYTLPTVIRMDGHIPLKIKSYLDTGVEQFDYVYGEDFGVVNVLQVRDGKITKYDKTELCKQIDVHMNWMPWSPVVVNHHPQCEGDTLTGGVAER